jgi:hypothetical protein
LAEEISKSVLESLTDKSAEYKNNVDAFAGKVQPRIVLWPYEDPAHFSVGAKQKWVIK